MAKDGTAEPAAKRAGEEIKRLREVRGWTRWQLATKLLYAMQDDDPSHDAVSETWLARLENGRMVKIGRTTLDAFCRALDCTSEERARLLLQSDRSVFRDHPNGPDPVAEALNYIMDQVYTEAYQVLDDALQQRHVHELDKTELLELVAKALRLVSRQ